MIEHTVHRGESLRLHVLREGSGRIAGFWGVLAVEPVVRKEGPVYVIRIEPPEGPPPAAPFDFPALSCRVEGKALLVTVTAEIAPTVSKRGALWFILSSPGL